MTVSNCFLSIDISYWLTGCKSFFYSQKIVMMTNSTYFIIIDLLWFVLGWSQFTHASLPDVLSQKVSNIWYMLYIFVKCPLFVWFLSFWAFSNHSFENFSYRLKTVVKDLSVHCQSLSIPCSPVLYIFYNSWSFILVHVIL